jgi:hypothetical protein
MCWLLGAGASHDLGGGREGIPLTSQLHTSCFFDKNKLVRLLVRLVKTGHLPSINWDEALGAQLNKTIDLVRSLCCAENTAIASYAASCLREIVSEIAVTISSEGYRFVATLMTDGHVENYGRLAALCAAQRQVSVVNMNYDCLLDFEFKSIWRFSNVSNVLPKPQQYIFWNSCLEALFSDRQPLTRGDHGVYVKLHGSSHLFSCQNEKCHKYRVPFAIEDIGPEGSRTFLVQLGSDQRCTACGRKALELILVPGHNLTEGEDRYLKMAFDLAREALIGADSWIILGYSCPTYDIDILNLLRDAMTHPAPFGRARQVIVVSPDPRDTAMRLRSELNYEVSAVDATFSQWWAASSGPGKS